MIDEKKLIEEIKKRRDYWESKADEYDEAGERYERMMDVCDGKAAELIVILSMIEEQPKVGEWIPCSERLPEKEAREYMRNDLNGIGRLYPCLLTYQNPNTKRIIVEEFYYYIDEQCFVTQAGRSCEKEHCLAWMPLPEPYSERSEGE